MKTSNHLLTENIVSFLFFLNINEYMLNLFNNKDQTLFFNALMLARLHPHFFTSPSGYGRKQNTAFAHASGMRVVDLSINAK